MKMLTERRTELFSDQLEKSRGGRRSRRHVENVEALRPPEKVGVFCETEPLKAVHIWGEPGPETLLAQLLPEDISLFYERFDVAKARDEHVRFANIIRNEGVDVIEVRDLLAKSLSLEDYSEAPRTEEDLVQAVHRRGEELYARYGVGDLAVLDQAEEIVREDLEDLGLEHGLALGYVLAIEPEIPLANMFYARDQSNVLGETVVFGRMRWPIRRPEVPLYQRAYQNGPEKTMRVSGNGAYFEGGDGIMLCRDCYIGAGGRSSTSGVEEIFSVIWPEITARGGRMFEVRHPKLCQCDQEGAVEIEAMHLDTYWMPVRPDLVAGCLEEMSQRRVIEYEANGGKKRVDRGRFDRFMDERGIEVIPVPKEEQVFHGTNFLNLGNDRAIISLSENKETVERMRERGITTIPADLKELTKGYGGGHCMSGGLVR